MKLEAHGLGLDAPLGWEARIERRAVGVAGESSYPVVHAATFPLPAVRGDYGSGAVEMMGPGDVFAALLEFGDTSVGSALFSPKPMPRSIDPEKFAPNQLQRWIPGQAGQQIFFTDQGRAFCLYIVIGSYTRRVELAARAEEIVRRILIDPVGPDGAL
jgi:hypothetical protein